MLTLGGELVVMGTTTSVDTLSTASVRSGFATGEARRRTSEAATTSTSPAVTSTTPPNSPSLFTYRCPDKIECVAEIVFTQTARNLLPPSAATDGAR
jgi:hypothetical protein